MSRDGERGAQLFVANVIKSKIDVLALVCHLGGESSLCSCEDGVEELDVPRQNVQTRDNMPLFMPSNYGRISRN